MKKFKVFLALGLFLLFAPLFLFSIGTVLILIWSVISFILPLAFAITLVFLLTFILSIIPIFFISLYKEVKRSKFEERFKTYKYNRVPSQFYLYK